MSIVTVLAWIVAAYLLVGLVYAATGWHAGDNQEAVDEAFRAVPELARLRDVSPGVARFSFYLGLVLMAVAETLTWPADLVRHIRRRVRLRRELARSGRD